MDHPAILLAQALNDSEIDELAPHERALIAAVNRATDHRTNVYYAANVIYGDTPKMHRACRIAADETCAIMLMRALDAYNAARELVS